MDGAKRMRAHRFSLYTTGVMILALAAAAMPAAAQERTEKRVDYSRSNFRGNPFGHFIPQEVPAPGYANTPRIDQLMRNGELRLSLSDAIALALENNLDLGIARYNLSIADTDILRTKAGGTARGVATGLVQGTPGGGVGGIGTAAGTGAGGTAAGAGGAGAGASGIVATTLGAGPAVPSFDPQITSTLSITHAQFPVSNTVTTGGQTSLGQNTGTANFTYSQAFATGTFLNIDYNNSRRTTTTPRDILVPQLNAGMTFQLRQRLLQGFGLGTNTRFIRIAKNNREISDVAFRNQVIASVSQIQNLYWDLVNAYEDVRVRERSMGLAQQTLNDNKRQVEIGTLAPIEIARAESEVALRRQELIVAQTNLQLQQLLMKNAITRNLTDPVLAAAPVVPTDTMRLPDVEPVVPIQDLLQEALSSRPDLAQARIDLTNRNINRKAARNALLPTVDLVASYGGSGLSGVQNPNATCAADPCSAAELSAGRFLVPGQVGVGGYGNAFREMWDSPTYTVGFQLTIPLRNRASQADQVRSELETRQAEMRMQQLQNQIGIEVRNAQFAVQQNRARVDAAEQGRELARQTLEAEQKKYALGASTNFQVLQAQRDLALAESNLVAAMSAYHKSRVELDRVTGQTLGRTGVDILDAERGQVSSLPIIRGVVPAQ
jgi:outer membrane protein